MESSAVSQARRSTRRELPVAAAASPASAAPSAAQAAGSPANLRPGRQGERGQVVAIGADDHHVPHPLPQMLEQFGAQRPDAHPGAGRELEILGDAPVEAEALGGIGGIDPGERVAHAEIPLGVEQRTGLPGIAPIARGHVRPAHARLELALDRRRLQFHAGDRQADDPGAADIRPAIEGERPGLGRAEAGHPRNAFARRRDRQPVPLVPHLLREAGAGEEDHAQSREQPLPQRGLAPEMRQQRLEALRHVEVDGGRDLAQVLDRRRDRAGQRPPGIDVERAAIGEHQPDIVVAAEGVVPGQPVDDHRRRVGEQRKCLPQHLLIAREHAVGVDHRLRQPGRAGGEQEFRRRIRIDPARRRIDRALVRRRQQRRETGRARGSTARKRRSRWPPPPRRAPPRSALRHRPARARVSARRRRGAAWRNRATAANRRSRPARRECRRARQARPSRA